MSNAVATVAFLQGQAWAKAPDGSLRPLSVGSTLNADEILVTAQGAQVQLDFGNGDPVVVSGGLEVAMSRDFSAETATEPNEAALDDASVQEALTVLEQGGDLLEELEETAAGDSGGGGSDGSSSFVQLTRILEQTDSQAFEYSSATTTDTGSDEITGGYVNRAPLVTDQTLASNEDEVLVGQIIASDIEGDAITYAVTTAPANGNLLLDATTGQFTFTPNANYNGSDSFVVTVTDSRGNASTTTVSLNIVPVNDAPTSNDINLTTDEDVPVNGQVVAQDIENDTLSYVVSGQPANGTVVLDPATGTFVYTPNANYNGSDSFVVTISDGNGGTTTSLVTVGINPVNDAPVSNDQNLVTDEDTPINGQVVASDVDGDSLGYSVSGQPLNGAVVLDPATGSFTYTPNANYNGSDSFIVTISDGQGGTTTSRINIGINPVNDAPVSSDQNLTTPEDVALAGQVVATDIEGDTLAYAVSGQPANGSVNLNPATGSFVYTPNANYNGSDSFIVTISDGNGGTTTSRINIGVTPVNDAPVSSNLNLTTPEDTPVSSQISGSDVDGDSLTYTVTGLPANGTVTINPASGSFVYSPATNFNGSDRFVVTISDGKGGTTTSVVNIGVTPVNDVPSTSNQTLTTNENVPVTGAVSGYDPDGDTLSYTLASNPANGTLVLNPATGAFTYTPSPGFNGSDSFVVTVSDGAGGTATSTVTIGVNPLNDAPVAGNLNLTTDEGVPVNGAISATDADGDSLSYSVTGVPAHGSVVLNPATGTFTYTPTAGYNGSDSFLVAISDGKGGLATSSVTIGINPVNDGPVAVADSILVDEGGVATTLVGGATSLLANDSDPDGDALTAILVSGPAHGTLTLNANGTFSYTHDGSETTADSFTYKVNDGTTDGNTVTVNISVTPVNNAPLAVDDVATVDEGSSVVVPVRGNDTDAENNTLTVTGVTQGANGSVVIDAITGNPIYTPNAGFNGNDSFTYTISDGNGGNATANVNVTVNPSLPSVLIADVGSAIEDSDAIGNVLANDTDPDDTLSVASFQVAGLGSFLAGQTANIAGVGSLSLASNGSYVFSPEANWNGAVPQVTYTTNTGYSSTLDITIDPVADEPIAVDDFYTINEDQPWTMPMPLTGLLGNDSDPDGDSLRVVLVTNINNGTVTVSGGDFIFTPTAEFSGLASFDYRITDDNGGFATGTVHINVLAVDDPTQAINDSKTVVEGSNAIGNVLANDIDPDTLPQVATFTINGGSYTANDSVTLPGVGTFTLLANGDYTFEPVDDNFNGTVPTVTYTTDTGASADLIITLTPENDAPVANDDSFTITANTDLVLSIPLVSLTANDTDVDGDSLSVNMVNSITNGTVQVTGGNFVFTPTPGFTGLASFVYYVNDGKGGSDSATVRINVVAAPNLEPETDALIVAGDEDTLLTINLSGSDGDGSLAGFIVKSLPANGILYSDASMSAPVAVGDQVAGPVYFMPAVDWNGSTGFSYAALDDKGSEDASPATVSITVAPAADNALIGTGSGMVKEDTPAQTTALGTLSISDPDAGEAAFNPRTNSPGTYGHFSIDAAGNWTYAIDNTNPAVQALKEGETRTDTFSVTSVDGTASSVAITVTGTNDGPVASADTASVNQDDTLTLTPAQLLANDTDLDGDTLSILSVQGAVNGSVSLVGGNVVFTPTPGYHGPASFTYTVSDGQGGNSTATVSVDVIKPNTAPVANNDTGAGSASNYGLFSEFYSYRQGVDGANLDNLAQVVAFVNSHAATATFRTTSLDYNRANVFGNGLGMGSNLQTFLGSDAASLSNDPANSSDAIIRMRGFIELAPGTYNFKVFSDDGYQIKVDGTVVAEVTTNQTPTTTTHNQFTISAGGVHTLEIVYWDQGWNAVFSAEISDNAGVTYKPFSAYSSYQTAALNLVEDTPLSIAASQLLTNDTDADGDILTIVSVQGAVNGTVALQGGNVVFTPAANYNGAASFTYTISDGKGGTSTATVNLQVTPVNDAPTAVPDSALATPNTTLNIPVSTLLANDSDPEGYALTLLSVQAPVNGTVTLSGNSVRFTPTPGYEGPASFSYTVQDQEGLNATATVSLTVGAASAPSVVVSKSLVAIAQGTGGTSVKFPIITKLVDTDGSETLSIKVSGVPSGLSFNAGINLGGGVWQFAEADLPNLMLNLPGSYTTNSTNLTVQVTATEVNGGGTATTSTAVNLKAGYTTVDYTTTESGSFTGSSANEFIQGGAGNNVINAGNGSNIVQGGGGNDTLSAGNGSDIIYGGSGNDVINTNSGNDRLIGGAGNDTLRGGDAGENFVDVFAWSLGDQGLAGLPAVDTIQNFSTAAAGNNGNGGDVLDLRDLLQGESVGPSNGAGNLADYLHFEVSGGNTVIHISHSGGFSADSHTVGAGFTSGASTQQIVLEGVNLQSLYGGATTDQQIITQLLNNNKLITD